jgi:hypothetical protein
LFLLLPLTCRSEKARKQGVLTPPTAGRRKIITAFTTRGNISYDADAHVGSWFAGVERER